MNEAKICSKCGAPQQWKMWRYCGCGHDFGSSIPVIVKPHEPQQPPEPHEEEYLTLLFERIHRWAWRLSLIATVIFALTKPFHALHWLSSAAGCGCVGLFLLPYPRKLQTPKNPDPG